jgi:large conductance mechanosensitive channel
MFKELIIMSKKIKTENLTKLKEKGKGFFGEFKEFVMRGNVMDMAIGVIIGAAFADIVTALTNDIINPLINGIGGAEVAGTLKIYGGQVIRYGDFITSIINFIIMAFVLFLLLKSFNKISAIGKKEEQEKEEEKKDENIVLLEEIRDLLKNKK